MKRRHAASYREKIGNDPIRGRREGKRLGRKLD